MEGNEKVASLNYKTAVIVRMEPENELDEEVSLKNIKVLENQAFALHFSDASKNANNLKRFQSVQTCIKSKRGLGEPIIVKFRAPMDFNEPEKDVNYDYKSMGDDLELILNDEHKYCTKMCLKMCYYI